MAYKKGGDSPQQDTGWGVIFRLNDLFKEVELLAPAGNYDQWNYKLDRIWSNLCYRTPLEIEKNKKGEVLSIKFDEDDIKIKYYLDNQILKAKNKMSTAKKGLSSEKDPSRSKAWVQGKKELYRAILLKEIWLRKYMYELGLYLKEVEHNPAGSMFGK